MATEYKDYYKVLGVKRDASQDEIKKAYRRLARKHHPDLHSGKDQGAAENKFKEINEAYQVLGDADNRKKYDQLGPNWKHGDPFRGFEGAGRPGGPGGGGPFTYTWSSGGGGGGPAGGPAGFGDLGGFSDFFQQLFGEAGRGPGGGGPRRGRGGGGARGFSMPGEDAVADVEVSLDEVLHGTRRSLHLSGLAPCSTCGGTGSAGDKPCPTCHGAGQVSRSQTIEVRIPPGINEGGQLRVRGKGNPGFGGGDPGDLLLRVHIAAHPTFQRVGDDLQVDLPLWPWEAVLGTEITVPVLDGSVKMKVPPGSQTGTRMKLRGKGLPGGGGQRGDQYVVLRVVVPKEANDDERALYERLAELRPTSPRTA